VLLVLDPLPIISETVEIAEPISTEDTKNIKAENPSDGTEPQDLERTDDQESQAQSSQVKQHNHQF
jgi:hypothetical protein